MEGAEALCDRVAIVSNGRLLAMETVPNLKRAYGYQYKATYPKPESPIEFETLNGASSDDVTARVQEQGVSEFSVSHTTLEDVFLALTGSSEGLGS
jgi:ABC-type multidrug transport system ATPase subunit